jgi:hypothetical protein
LGGWSEKMIELIPLIETGLDSLITRIESVNVIER